MNGAPSAAGGTVTGMPLRRREVLSRGAWLSCWAIGATPAAVRANPGNAGNAKQHALVIGNAAYEAAPLRNPKNDARLVTRSLRTVGFEVAVHEDLALEAMRSALAHWLTVVGGAGVRFFYFAGHGAQFRGRNYMLPVDAEFEREDDVLHRGVDIATLVDRLSLMARGVNVVVLDACRDHAYPLTRRVGPTRTRAVTGSVEPGLTPVVPAQGTVVAFSTAPGAVALDGKGGNSAYARHLAAQLLVPGQPIEAMFKRVRHAVARDTANQQVPWESSSLVGDFCVRPDDKGSCNAPRATSTAVDLGR
jgi:uncharacterized caspase-like protein